MDDEFNITLFEACEFLTKSKKSVGRYVRLGKLHPEEIKSKQGTLEYRFSKIDLEQCRELILSERRQDRQTRHEPEIAEEDEVVTHVTLQTEETGQTRKTEQTDKTSQNEIIDLLKETTGILREQLKVKDEQIKNFQERDRETNVLLQNLQETIQKGYDVPVRIVGDNKTE